MIKTTQKLALKSILTCLVTMGGFISPAIAQSNQTITDKLEPFKAASSMIIANNKQLKDEFRCELGEDNFSRTIAYTKLGRRINLITWKGITNQGSGYSPEVRCRIVANRFQRFSNAGKLRYVSTGRMNNHPIVCISSNGGQCQTNGLLLTLDPKDNPEQTLKELFDVGSRADGGDFVRAGKGGKTVIDITQLIYSTP